MTGEKPLVTGQGQGGQGNGQEQQGAGCVQDPPQGGQQDQGHQVQSQGKTRGQQQPGGQGQGQAPQDRAATVKVFTETLDIQGTFPLILQVYIGLRQGLTGPQIATKLGWTRQHVHYYIEQITVKKRWMKGIKGTYPKHYEPGDEDHEAELLLVKLSQAPRGQAVQGLTDISASNGGHLDTALDTSPLISGKSLTLNMRIHRVQYSAPIEGSFSFKDYEAKFENVQPAKMKPIRYVFSYAGRDLEVMGRTLTVHLADAIVDTGPGLMAWRAGVKKQHEGLRKQLREIGITVGQMGRICATYAFPDFGDALGPVFSYIFEDSESWVDHSTGRDEFETRSFHLALLVYYLPSVVSKLCRDVEELKRCRRPMAAEAVEKGASE